MLKGMSLWHSSMNFPDDRHMKQASSKKEERSAHRALLFDYTERLMDMI